MKYGGTLGASRSGWSDGSVHEKSDKLVFTTKGGGEAVDNSKGHTEIKGSDEGPVKTTSQFPGEGGRGAILPSENRYEEELPLSIREQAPVWTFSGSPATKALTVEGWSEQKGPVLPRRLILLTRKTNS